MKRVLFILSLICICATSFGSGDSQVYICMGKYATTYHKSPECSGLNNCKASIKAVTLRQAQEMRRTPCKKCY